MKKTQIIFCLILLTATTTHAYWWRFSNFTTKILLLKVKLIASNNPYYAIVYPNTSALFDWSPPNALAGFCFDKVQWIEAPPEILNNSNLVDENHTVISNKQINKLFFGKEALFSLYNASIEYFSNETYKRTVKNAQSLFGKQLIKWAAKKHAQSICRSRHIIIEEDIDGNIKFLTQKN